MYRSFPSDTEATPHTYPHPCHPGRKRERERERKREKERERECVRDEPCKMSLECIIYKHTCMYTFIHTYMNAYLRTYIHANK